MNKNMHKPGRLAAWLSALAILLTCSGALADAVLPKGIEVIEESAFEGCNALGTMELPESLQTLGERALARCATLGLITVRSQSLKLGEDALGEEEESKVVEAYPGTSVQFYVDGIPEKYGWEFHSLVSPSQKLIAYAETLLGTSYSKMDCVTYARHCYMKALGITIENTCPKVQQNMGNYGGKRIDSIDDLLPGDILCWSADSSTADPTRCTHVGIYVGAGTVDGKEYKTGVFIESSSGAGKVRYWAFQKATYYTKRFMNAWRMF